MSERINMHHKGAEWRKWDLHFHTPTSYDYKDKSVTNQEIIDGLVSNDIAVVAITDHHIIDVERIKELQELGKDKVTILPGIEFLCESRGSEPIHFIGIFPETCNIQYVWEQIKNTTNLKKIEGEGKAVNEVYCDLEETTKLIRNLGGLASIHAGSKSNSIDNITHALPHGIAQKEDIAKAVDIFELGKEEDIAPYTKLVNAHLQTKINKTLPLIICSDNHDIKNYVVKQNLWIKADTNFEGLKQIIYEPNERVAIQANKPEEKTGYQVIDYIEIASASIFDSKISFNSNLNSIIGGRSSGKSVILGAIAKKVKATIPIELSDKEYQDYVQSISNTIKVVWQDGKEENEREVEYFEQGYMHKIARNESQLNNIINDILVQKGKESVLDEYNRFLTDNAKSINGVVSDYFRVLQDIREKEKKARDKGDKSGIESEISKLETELNLLPNTTITEEEKREYEQVKTDIEANIQEKQTLINDIVSFEKLKNVRLLIDNIDYELVSLTESNKESISTIFNLIKSEVETKWSAKLNELIASTNREKDTLIQSVSSLEANVTYTKVSRAYKENVQLAEYETKIKTQKNKLAEITSVLLEIDRLKVQLAQTKDKIKVAHKAFYDKIIELIPNLSIAKDGLEIKAKWKFDEDKYRNILSGGLNLQGYENQKIASYQYSDFTDFERHQIELFDKLVNNELTLKGGNDSARISSSILSTNFFNLSYDIEYEDDDFKKMSDGKKAFVVLKLLLDFSDKKCPILIDQPEDDLDNRAIYNDLVQYLRKKKKERQIIVATHNPNIVVGADSELVICANQHGEKNINNSGKKFQYVTGSLEHSFSRDSSKLEILESQGTREHVCEVLEGGNTAFKLREKKYSIKE